jgi:RNA-binding protein
MEPLTSSQRKALRGMAHSLEPVVHVGQAGVTDGVAAEVDRALDAHELIKVRMVGSRQEKAQLVADLEERTGCRAAGTVGHVAILYRRHPEPERRRIRLPEAAL